MKSPRIRLARLGFFSLILISCIICFLLPSSMAEAAGVTLPAGLKKIEQEAFYGDTSLDQLTIPDSVAVIEYKAFARSGLREVTLPASLYSIADNAFEGCSDLTVNAPEGSYAYTWAVKNHYIQIEDVAPGDTTKVFVPDTLQAGADLIVQVDGSSDTLRHSVYVVNDRTGDYQYRQINSPQGAITVNGYWLNSEDTYRVIVYTATPQYESVTPVVKIFTVSGQKPAPLAVSLPEEMEPNETKPIKSEDYTSVRLKCKYYSANGEQLDAGSDPNEDYISSNYIDSWPFRPNGVNDGYIKVVYSGFRDGLWSEWSEEQTVAVAGVDYLAGDVDFPDTYVNGTDCEIRFEYQNSPGRYQYNLRSSESSEYTYSVMKELYNAAGTINLQLSSYNLSPGQYTFTLDFYPAQNAAVAYAGGNAARAYAAQPFHHYQKTFEVIEASGEKPETPVVTCDHTRVFVDTYVGFTVSTSAAEKFSVRCVNPHGTLDCYTVSSQGESSRWSNRPYTVGTYQYRFSVFADEKWSDWSAPIEIQVKERPRLQPAVIHVPSAVPAGMDAKFSFDAVDNATEYHIEFRSVYEEEEASLYWDTQNVGSTVAVPGTEMTIPGYLLSAGEYIIRVHASAEGYSGSSQEAYVTVSGTRPAGPEVTVEGQMRVRSTPVFRVNTANAEVLQIQYQYNSSSMRSGIYNKSISATGETTPYSLYIDEYDQGATLTISFAVQKEGVWSAWSTADYEIESLPPLDQTEIHMDDMINAGTDFVMTFDPIDNATSYRCEIIQSSNGNISSYFDNSDNPYTVRMKGYDFDPGEYAVRVYASSDGYATSVSEKTFTITGLKPTAPAVTVDRSEVKAREKYCFTVDTKNADLLCYRISRGGTNRINVFEDETQWETYSYNSGIFEYRFAVRREGVWSVWSDPIIVNVSDAAPTDLLASPEISVISELGSGRNLTVALTAVEGASEYYIGLSNSDGTVNFSQYLFGQENLTYSIPGYWLIPGTYTISAQARNGNISGRTSRLSLEIPDSARPSAPGVSLPDGNVTDDYASFVIDTTGADQVVARYFSVGYTNNINYETRTVQDGQNETVWQLYHYGANRRYSFAVCKDGIWSEWSGFIGVKK